MILDENDIQHDKLSPADLRDDSCTFCNGPYNFNEKDNSTDVIVIDGYDYHPSCAQKLADKLNEEIKKCDT